MFLLFSFLFFIVIIYGEREREKLTYAYLFIYFLLDAALSLVNLVGRILDWDLVAIATMST